MWTVNETQGLSQENLSPSDRRLLLAASLRLFLRRLNHGLTVRRNDVLRVVEFADGDGEAAA
jgi:hypothetical protein